jgi:hypothetical protein
MIKPSKVIGENYLSRWHVIPRNPVFNIYLHKFTGSDDDRAKHDHPFASFSIKLHGQMLEHYGDDKVRFANTFTYRKAKFAHRLEIVAGPVWTIFFTGPRIREWGFHCPQGWKHWSKMTTPDGKQIGGCE